MHPTLEWRGAEDGVLALLDQTLLPHQQVVLELRELDPVIDAIKRLAVRGAPAIGVAAAYGMVVGVRERQPADAAAFATACGEVGDLLKASRPTAVNLGWAVDRLLARAANEPTVAALLAEARAVHEEDERLCLAMGEFGAQLINDGMTVLTHCNAGRLATAGDGTALAVMFAAHRLGKKFKVLADETRPLLQGARLTALELAEEGIPVQVIADSAAAGLMARGEIDVVVTGADRVAANGDVANKVGTYSLSLAAKAHNVPMYVVAPMSTFDLSIPDGSHIPIEDRDPAEVLEMAGSRVAAAGVGARNPAFDVTPAAHLSGLVTDRGIIRPVTTDQIKAVLG
ncbi:MAG: S-methyl-5-thioribose-1-phosphate isomerase [Planctomycetota bacterium]